MTYRENPKQAGSGLLSCIPQRGRCKLNCHGCFYNGGRSYLEPLDENTPNIPLFADTLFKVVRVNDGNDSNNDRELVIQETSIYKMKFYNTSVAANLSEFPDPVVLTINPADSTDKFFAKLDKAELNDVMFVRFRTNTWNLKLAKQAVDYYTGLGVPVVLTFMAYDIGDEIHRGHLSNYTRRVRTTNEYFAITNAAYKRVMKRFEDNLLVYSCGRDGLEHGSLCKHCGNCLREYFATMERISLNRVDANGID